ncbi:MAG: hypothetical protein GXO24_03580 [Chlorobi bacterium]|nr:hypothetical protein [Chlorobiota bacterium]
MKNTGTGEISVYRKENVTVKLYDKGMKIIIRRPGIPGPEAVGYMAVLLFLWGLPLYLFLTKIFQNDSHDDFFSRFWDAAHIFSFMAAFLWIWGAYMLKLFLWKRKGREVFHLRPGMVHRYSAAGFIKFDHRYLPAPSQKLIVEHIPEHGNTSVIAFRNNENKVLTGKIPVSKQAYLFVKMLLKDFL